MIAKPLQSNYTNLLTLYLPVFPKLFEQNSLPLVLFSMKKEAIHLTITP